MSIFFLLFCQISVNQWTCWPLNSLQSLSFKISHYRVLVCYFQLPPYLYQESFLLQNLDRLHLWLHCTIDRKKKKKLLWTFLQEECSSEPIYVATFEWGRIFFLERELEAGIFAQKACGSSLTDRHRSISGLNNSCVVRQKLLFDQHPMGRESPRSKQWGGKIVK